MNHHEVTFYDAIFVHTR